MFSALQRVTILFLDTRYGTVRTDLPMKKLFEYLNTRNFPEAKPESPKTHNQMNAASGSIDLPGPGVAGPTFWLDHKQRPAGISGCSDSSKVEKFEIELDVLNANG